MPVRTLYGRMSRGWISGVDFTGHCCVSFSPMTHFSFAYLVVRVTVEWKWKSAVNDDGLLFLFFFFLRDILILIQIFLSEFLHAKNMHAKSKIKILKIWDRNIENIRHIYNYISLLPILINNNKLFPNLKETKIFS